MKPTKAHNMEKKQTRGSEKKNRMGCRDPRSPGDMTDDRQKKTRETEPTRCSCSGRNLFHILYRYINKSKKGFNCRERLAAWVDTIRCESTRREDKAEICLAIKMKARTVAGRGG